MTEESRRKGHCPKCGPDRHSDIVAEYRDKFDIEDTCIWGVTDYKSYGAGDAIRFIINAAKCFPRIKTIDGILKPARMSSIIQKR